MLGGIVGAGLFENLGGFIIGAGVGGVGVAEILASTATAIPMPPELEQANPQLREKYRQAYRDQTRVLRRKSIYNGMIGVACATGLGLLLLVAMAS
ncbi:MAG: hypothetical protein ACETWG_01555 [Candidatus Neomarinimicrobiota bacterium]